MKRRGALCTFGSLAILLWSGASAGQSATKVHRIGTLHSHVPSEEAIWRATFAPFIAQLRTLGWVEGRNLIIEHRSGDGDSARMRQGARDLVRLSVELIVTTGTGPTIAAKEATSSIAIVSTGSDPVAMGVVKSLNDPGRNVTGFYTNSLELVRKRLELTRELLPNLDRIALIHEEAYVPRKETFMEYERLCESFGVQLVLTGVTTTTEIEPAVAKAVEHRVQAIMAQSEGFWTDERVDTLVGAAKRRRLPVIVASKYWTQRGALLGLEGDPDGEESTRATAYFVDKILRGARPADLPIQQATRFALSINAKTAKEIGLTIPPSLVARADHVYR